MTTLVSLSQLDDILSLSSRYNNNNDNNNNSFLQDYETVSELDLFHSSEPESFKDIERQRRHRKWASTHNSTIKKLNKSSLKVRGEARREQHDLKILENLEQRREHHADSNDNGGTTESDQDESNSSSSSSKNNNKTKAKKERNARQLSNKKSHDFELSASFSSGSDSDRKRDSNNMTKSNEKPVRPTDRSNKRADRHRRPEDEIPFSSDDFGDSEDSECDFEGKSMAVGASYEEYEERIRFKRNLNFKTDDSSSSSSNTPRCARKLGSNEWKQVYVEKLDEKDQHRAQQGKQQSRSRYRS
ncbi:hypothetical protein BGZ65_002538 [Modicella reniformis]|uniref:Uncharacterized protein n=1 Tax=Modicella reniformis TaxID=1440133 RepID=A0A9P6MIR2_9FUNG|nr:hypothetical protein BGZ65_002538 [Modicella reniformis]